jgi:hypothetical protein
MKALPLALLVAASAIAQPRFAFRDLNGLSLELTENGQPVFDYNYGMIWKAGNPQSTRRSTYLHPVWAPDGTPISEDYNRDHPHHRGIFWAWPVVVVDGKTFDLWEPGHGIEQRFLRWTAREANDREAVLGAENGWYAGDRKVVKETVEIRVAPRHDGTRDLSFRLTFEATDRPVEIAGTPDENKGYGGLSIRLAPADGGGKATTIRTDQSVIRKDGVLEITKWAEVEALFQGHRERVRMEDDPRNPGYPNGWLLRHGFPFMNVSYPGLPHLTLEPGKPLVLHYKVTVISPNVQ